MAVNFLLKRSNTASKRPTAAQLDIGELSLNYDANTAGVFFEDSGGNIRKVGPAEVSATAPNATPAGSSGNSLGELWYDTGTSTLKVWTGAAFANAMGTATAGGSNTQVQYNSSNVLAGSANFTFDGTTASIAGLAITGSSIFRAAATQDGVAIVGRAGGTSSYEVTLTPTTLTADRTLTLPDATGTVGLVAGSNTQIQFNNNGALGGSSLLIWDGTRLKTNIIQSNFVSGAEGGQIELAVPASGSSLSGTHVAVDIQTNSFRVFEDGGTRRGIKVDLTAQAGGQSTIATSSSKLSLFSATTSAELAGVISDETGSGSLVFGTSPALTTPALDGETFSVTSNVTAGTNAQGQGALTKDYNVITTAAANPSGVTLPTATTGRRIAVVNKGANPVNVYPATGASIDALVTNASIQLPVNGMLEFLASSTTQWYSTANEVTDAGNLTGTIPSAVLGNSSLYVGTTQIALNRASAAQSLTGITSIDGSAATLTTTRTLWGQNFNGSANVTGSLTSVGDITATASITVSSATTNAITVDSGTTGNVNLGTGANAKAIAIGNSGVASTIALNNNTTLPAGKTLTLSGATSGTIALQATATAGTTTITFPATTGTVALTANNLSVFASTTSAQLAGIISDETGSGSLVFATSPTLTTPAIGAATGTSLALTGGTLTTRAAATQDGVIIAGRAGGTSDFDVTITPTTLTADRTLTLPDTTGTVGVVAGSNEQIQFNNNGVLGASSGLTWISSQSVLAATTFRSTTSSGPEGGQYEFTRPATGATYTGNIVLDAYQNQIRLFASGGGSPGAYVDMSILASGVGSQIATSANNLSIFAATTSAQLAGVISDETGSGSLVFGTSPSITTSLTTGSTSFDLLNTTATTINFGSAASSIRMGAAGLRVGFGGVVDTAVGLYFRQSLAGGTSAYGTYMGGAVGSGVTSSASGHFVKLSTDAASFTCPVIYSFYADQGTYGAGSTVTSHVAYYVSTTLKDATNNHGLYLANFAATSAGKNSYGIRSELASGSGGGTSYFIYATGNAPSSFGGYLGVGTTNPIRQIHIASTSECNLLMELSTAATDEKMWRQYVSSGNSFNFVRVNDTFTSEKSFYRVLNKTGGGGDTDYQAWYQGGVEKMRLVSDTGNLKIGGTATRGTTEGTFQLVLFNGTAPVGTLTNGISFYSASGEARVMDAAGNSTLLSPHDQETNEWIYDSTDTRTGKRLKIRMEAMMRFLNEHFGLDFVQDFIEEVPA